MIIDELVLKCKRKIPAVYRSGLMEENVFPWVVPLSKEHLLNDLAVWKAEVEKLRAIDKNIIGYGPRIEYEKRNSRKFGEQFYPSKIIFDNIEDFLTFSSAKDDWIIIQDVASKLKSEFPQLISWLHKPSAYKRIIEHQDHWDELILVCKFLNERSSLTQLFIRELPLAISSKFIEENISILKELLDHVLDAKQVNQNENDFYKRFNLSTDKSRVRIRLLDEALQLRFFNTNAISDIELPADDFDKLLCSRENSDLQIFVIENLTSFLTFPNFSCGIAILGGGFYACSIEIKGIMSKPILYWGDIDAQGLEILALFRKKYPLTKSFLMNFETLKDHSDRLIQGEDSNFLTPPTGLTKVELELYLKIRSEKQRLEQEKISSNYILEFIENCINQ